MTKILLIDDNSKLVSVYEELIQSGGYETITITDGRETIPTLERELPDLVLLDLMMEPLSGWDVLTTIRTDHRFDHVSVLVLTGKRLEVDDIIRYGDQIDGYLVKPLRGSELLAIIAEHAHYNDLARSIYRSAEEKRITGMDASELLFLARKPPLLKILYQLLEQEQNSEETSSDTLVLKNQSDVIIHYIQRLETRRKELESLVQV